MREESVLFGEAQDDLGHLGWIADLLTQVRFEHPGQANDAAPHRADRERC
jgi:hypothetical protein